MKFRIKSGEVAPGDLVKVRIHVPAGSEKSRAQWREDARAWADEHEVELQAIQIIAPTASPGKIAARARERAPDAELVKAYAKKMKKGKVTLAAGLKIVKEAP